MCNFLSGIITREHYPRMLCANLLNHDSTVSHYKFRPEQYREWEWTADDDGASLKVRTIFGEDANALKSAILALWPTRRLALVECIRQICEFGGGLPPSARELDMECVTRCIEHLDQAYFELSGPLSSIPIAIRNALRWMVSRARCGVGHAATELRTEEDLS